jgi:glycosyltransferase involved in cell wall biosynthesis
VKILVVNWQDRLNPQSGGAEVHLHEIFGRLAAAGHDVTLLASGFRDAPPRIVLDGMQVHRVGGRHTFALRAAPYYRRMLASEGFDVVVEDLNKIPLFTPRWVGAPVVVLVHHLFGLTAFREASAPIAAATWVLEQPTGSMYRGIPTIAVSDSTRDDLVARGLRRDDIEVIYNGIDLDFFTPDPDRLRAEVPTFVYMGRLRRYKAVDLGIRAVGLLRDQGVHVRFVIGGKGPHQPALRELVGRLGLEDRVEFVGFVSEEHKRELLREAWANLYTSPKEGWGITNLEAGACGTPTVASDSPGLRESVVHELTGLLVPHGDVSALAAAMRRIAHSPAEVERMGTQAHEFAQRFSWDGAATLTERALRQACERRRPSTPPALSHGQRP